MIKKDLFGGSGILVWVGIMLGSRTDLRVLLSNIRLFRGAMDIQSLFMDENPTSHLTMAIAELLESDSSEEEN